MAATRFLAGLAFAAVDLVAATVGDAAQPLHVDMHEPVRSTALVAADLAAV